MYSSFTKKDNIYLPIYMIHIHYSSNYIKLGKLENSSSLCYIWFEELTDISWFFFVFLLIFLVWFVPRKERHFGTDCCVCCWGRVLNNLMIWQYQNFSELLHYLTSYTIWSQRRYVQRSMFGFSCCDDLCSWDW